MIIYYKKKKKEFEYKSDSHVCIHDTLGCTTGTMITMHQSQHTCGSMA